MIRSIKKSIQENYEIDDIRQLSGYARDKGILKKLNISENEMLNTVVPCLIIYPNQDSNNSNFEDFGDKLIEDKKTKTINEFTKFYKIGIKLPTTD